MLSSKIRRLLDVRFPFRVTWRVPPEGGDLKTAVGLGATGALELQDKRGAGHFGSPILGPIISGLKTPS